MKHYVLGNMMPNTNQFHAFVKEKTAASDFNRQTIAYKAVYSLFQGASSLYKSLEFCTSERLPVFVDAKKYLSRAQEHDLVALTALHILAMVNSDVEQIVDQDPVVLEHEKSVLKAALKLFRDTAQATHNALGNPRWIDD